MYLLTEGSAVPIGTRQKSAVWWGDVGRGSGIAVGRRGREGMVTIVGGRVCAIERVGGQGGSRLMSMRVEGGSAVRECGTMWVSSSVLSQLLQSRLALTACILRLWCQGECEEESAE
jgi:hypothetical protein